MDNGLGHTCYIVFDCGGGGKHHVPILSDPHRARPQGVHEADDGSVGYRTRCLRDELPNDGTYAGVFATVRRVALTLRRHVHRATNGATRAPFRFAIQLSA